MGARNCDEIENYTKICNEQLKLINFPIEFHNSADSMCDELSHHSVINKLYTHIVQVLKDASAHSRLRKVNRVQNNVRKVVVGWNKYVSE